MTTRNKRKLAALNKENCEEHLKSNLAQNSSAARSQEDYITQVSEEIEGRVTKRLSKEFSRTENRILGALARLDDFLMNPLLPGYSGATPEPTRNALSNNQGTNEDDSQNDPHPEAGLFHGQTTRNTGPEDGHDTKYPTTVENYGGNLAKLSEPSIFRLSKTEKKTTEQRYQNDRCFSHGSVFVTRPNTDIFAAELLGTKSSTLVNSLSVAHLHIKILVQIIVVHLTTNSGKENC